MKPGQTDPTKELGPGGCRDPAEREAKIRRALETQTRQAEDELRAIIDNAPVFLWSDLPDGYCDFLNQRWLTYFNLSLQEAQGAGWATLLHPDDAAHHLESWQKSVSTGTPFETEARFRRSDGEYRCFLTRAIPLHDKTGKIVKWYGTNIDIENLKRTERRLRQSEAYLAEAQRLSHTGTWAFNATTTLYWSEESYRIWGSIRCRVSRAAKLCGNGSIQTTETGCTKRPSSHCSRKETWRSSSESCCPMEQSNILNQSAVLCFPPWESLSR